MKTFGNKDEFAMSIDFYTDKYKDDEYLQENIEDFVLGAEVYFWVKGKNLFAFKQPAEDITYSYYNLYALVDFLSDYLVHHITEIPFPMETQASNAADMIEETLLFEKGSTLDDCAAFDWDSVDMDLRDRIDTWVDYRSFLFNNAGTFLPDLYVRKVKDQIELSWNNVYPHNDGTNKFYMLYTKGVEYVDAALYREVVTQFCFYYIERIKQENPKAAELYRKNLRKAMRVPI